MVDHYTGLTFVKDPDAVLDYAFDWNDADDPWLATLETIDSYVVTVPSGITLESDAQADGVVTIFLSGGTSGTSYKVRCAITTSQGRTQEKAITIRVEDNLA